MNGTVISRRGFWALMTLVTGIMRPGKIANAQTLGAEYTKLGEIRHVPADFSANCARVRLASGQTWSVKYPGPFSATVEAGVMSVPMAGERHLQIVRYPSLNGTPTVQQQSGSDFPSGWGIFAESGDYS